ncbi:MAG: hypothetical protein HQL32_13985 [Planctomycetes bacterium]|nr:hypothetical protein [Planctomycetota bacterium]
MLTLMVSLFKTLLLLLLLAVKMDLYATEKLPKISSQGAQTQAFLLWSKKTLKEVSLSPSQAKGVLSSYRNLLKHFKNCQHEEIVKNNTFYGDVQKITNHFQQILHYHGKAGIKEKWPVQKFKALIQEMDQHKSPNEISLPFLIYAGQTDRYYRNYLSNIEEYEKHPERLLFRPKIPPLFKLEQKLAPMTLHNILALYDICKKHYWEPNAQIEEKILIPLARQYESHGLYHFALSALAQVNENHLSNKILQEKVRLEKLHHDKQKSQNQEADLY